MKKEVFNLVQEFLAFGIKAPNPEPIRIRQNVDEVVMVISFLYPRKFKHFVEIGSAEGGSLWVYSNLLCESKALIEPIEADPLNSFRYVTTKINDLGFTVNSWHGLSYELHNRFDKNIDLLHIDGSHNPEAVKRDWNDYYPKVVDGGVILIHDTIYGHEGPSMLRERLEKDGYNIRTFYTDVNPCGISLVIK